MKKKIYIYPITARTSKIIPNPYLEDLCTALSNHYTIVNRNDPSRSGIFQLFRYVFRIDYLYLNWIEDLPDKKLGALQTFIFKIFVAVLHFRGAKLIWTLHNKLSHYPQNLEKKKRLQKFLYQKSDYIVTHAQEGKEYLTGLYPQNECRAKFLVIPHPVHTPEKIPKPGEKKLYDFLIWGTILEYKGIHLFLDYLKTSGKNSDIRILIAGKIPSKSYEKKLLEYKTGNVKILNRYISDDELLNFFTQSRFVLFLYQDDSVIGSGALMETLSYEVPVIGPNKAAYKELNAHGVISVFNDLDEIPEILKNYNNFEDTETHSQLLRFKRDNTWNKFAMRFFKFLNE